LARSAWFCVEGRSRRGVHRLLILIVASSVRLRLASLPPSPMRSRHEMYCKGDRCSVSTVSATKGWGTHGLRRFSTFTSMCSLLTSSLPIAQVPSRGLHYRQSMPLMTACNARPIDYQRTERRPRLDPNTLAQPAGCHHSMIYRRRLSLKASSSEVIVRRTRSAGTALPDLSRELSPTPLKDSSVIP
jgi:hypothetical protein